jgi:hypothetical protein
VGPGKVFGSVHLRRREIHSSMRLKSVRIRTSSRLADAPPRR